MRSPVIVVGAGGRREREAEGQATVRIFTASERPLSGIANDAGRGQADQSLGQPYGSARLGHGSLSSHFCAK
jgi:hypothetical protein